MSYQLIGQSYQKKMGVRGVIMVLILFINSLNLATWIS